MDIVQFSPVRGRSRKILCQIWSGLPIIPCAAAAAAAAAHYFSFEFSVWRGRRAFSRSDQILEKTLDIRGQRPSRNLIWVQDFVYTFQDRLELLQVSFLPYWVVEGSSLGSVKIFSLALSLLGLGPSFVGSSGYWISFWSLIRKGGGSIGPTRLSPEPVL